MKIAVIIPHKNGGARLERCLASLQAQTEIEGVNFKFITVDDNPHCSDQPIVSQYRALDVRFLPLVNEKTPGVSGARNTGIHYAIDGGADYITFLDADDTWLPDATAQITRAIAANPAAPIIELDHLRHYVEIDKTVNKYAVPRCSYKFGTSNRAWCFVWNKIYTAQIIGSTRFVEGLQFGEDEIFNIDILAKHNEIIHDDRYIALKRYFDNKQSLSRSKDRNGLLAQNDALIDALNRHADKPEIAKNICMLIGEHWQSPTYLAKFGEGAL